MKKNGEFGYFVVINLVDNIKITLNNITFKDNECESLYDGGSGLWFSRTSKLSFSECKFIGNHVVQIINDNSRPIKEGDPPYYNGDGGGLQYGYTITNDDVDMEFNICTFRDTVYERFHYHCMLNYNIETPKYSAEI